MDDEGFEEVGPGCGTPEFVEIAEDRFFHGDAEVPFYHGFTKPMWYFYTKLLYQAPRRTMDDDDKDLMILDAAIHAERVRWTDIKSETALLPRTLSGHLTGLVRSGLLHEMEDGTYAANRAGMALWAQSLLARWGYPGGRKGRESWFWLETGRGLLADQMRAIRWLRDLPPGGFGRLLMESETVKAIVRQGQKILWEERA